MAILGADGKPMDPKCAHEHCDHGVTFDAEEARKLVDNWDPQTPTEFVMGPPGATEVRKRWPRLSGDCPKGCGFHGIAYASYEHYIAGDW